MTAISCLVQGLTEYICIGIVISGVHIYRLGLRREQAY